MAVICAAKDMKIIISRRESNMDFVIGILIGLFSGVMIGILTVALVSANRDDKEDKS